MGAGGEAVYIIAATLFAPPKDHLATHGRDIHIGTGGLYANSPLTANFLGFGRIALARTRVLVSEASVAKQRMPAAQPA